MRWGAGSLQEAARRAGQRQRDGDPAGGRGHRASDPPQSRPGAASSGRRGKAAGGAAVWCWYDVRAGCCCRVHRAGASPSGRRVLSSVQRGGVQQRGRRCKVQTMAGVSCPARGGVLSPSPIQLCRAGPVRCLSSPSGRRGVKIGGVDHRRGSSARRRVQTAAAAGGCDLHTGGGAGV